MLHGVLGWLVGIAVVVVFISIAINDEKRRQANQRLEMLRNSLLSTVDLMTGAQFERYFAQLLRLRGHRSVQVVGGAGDGGVDVLATTPDGAQAAYQCKRQKTTVSVQVVRQLLGSVTHEHPGRIPHLVTNATLTKPAADLAKSSGVRVVDRRELGKWMDEARAHLEPRRAPDVTSGVTYIHGPVSHSAAVVPEEIIDLVRRGSRITAITRYRQMTGLGLAEAKEIIDRIK